ncbi:MAG: helix-turn-helix domain-containing protein [Hyphomicrobiales bacterium]|nr:helix-turn-helix domain-containing protein [Hyphomicrobiales bacterium]
MQEQPFAVLAMLLERAGELVTREELRDRIWTHTLVDFDHGIVPSIRCALSAPFRISCVAFACRRSRA